MNKKTIIVPAVLLVHVSIAWTFPVPEIPFAPRSYVSPRTSAAPVIDGLLDDSAWHASPWTEDFVDIVGPSRPQPALRTRAKMSWDQDYFYVAAELDEPHVWATLTERDAVIYHDNDFEVFIDPDGDNHQYYELEINALGTEWDLFLVKPYRDGGPALNAWDIQGLKTAVDIAGTLNDPSDRDRGWSVEIAIPWSVLAEAAGRAAPPEIGDVWRVNFSRVQWPLDVNDGTYVKVAGAAEDNWVWSPQGLVAMHYPEMWGQVVFSDLEDQKTGPSPEIAAIAEAARLMPIYYAQRRYHEEHGHFAGDVNLLGLPDQEGLEMTADRDRFTARIDGDHGPASIDETGRLRRHP